MSRRRLRIVLSSRIARLLGCATIALVALIASPSDGRMPATRFDALPRAAERLGEPIWLPHCGMRVVEWRSTASLRQETTQSEQAIAVLDETCRTAFERYGEFLRAKGLPRLHVEPDVLPAISLLPGNTLLDGKSPRALNDLPTRFEAVAPGCCYWGLYVDSLNHLFLRNDPLTRDDAGKLTTNPRFVRTLTHEISHVLSSRLGVWDVVGYDRQRDEDLAEEFVAFMGMRFPAESSAEDLAFHRGDGVRRPPAAQATATAAPPKARPPQVPPPSASANTSPQR
ncbi:MAG TPA: hypothetical protein VE987_09945 [Polyangiaceae bacterium]|nr:hypothetical protein [Polyangiaceae bacterium]